MSEKDRKKWNERYLNREYPSEPSDIVRRFFHLAAKDTALDIAAGAGRNAMFLAREGFSVDAVDISDVAMKQLSAADPRIRTVNADFDTYRIPQSGYSLIVNVNFLNRCLFPYIIEGLKPEGVVIFETYIEAPGEDHATMQKDYLLRRNELLHAFLPLRIVYYREFMKPHRKGDVLTASLVAVNR